MRARIRVVLVRPRRGGNVGAVARAMKNMGLRDLVLVAPRARIGASAAHMAVHAEDVLERRRTVAGLDEALADCTLAVGTIGREIASSRAIETPRGLAASLLAGTRRGRTALVFGPEDHGLSNAELDRCQVLLRIPADPAYGSLNLAQAVLLCAYELRLAAEGAATATTAAIAATAATARGRGRTARRTGRDDGRSTERRAGRNDGGRAGRVDGRNDGGRAGRVDGRNDGRHAGRRDAERDADARLATGAEREALIAHLEEALARIGFLPRQNPAHIMRDVRSLLGRAGLTRRDVRVWRGIARQVLWASRAVESTRRE